MFAEAVQFRRKLPEMFQIVPDPFGKIPGHFRVGTFLGRFSGEFQGMFENVPDNFSEQFKGQFLKVSKQFPGNPKGISENLRVPPKGYLCYFPYVV